MKRSEINRSIILASQALRRCSFVLPPFAHWPPETWNLAKTETERIRANGLGWHVTDFGLGNFDQYGAVLFTLRNGNPYHPELGTPYAEKVIILKPGQRLPLHFHWSKTEDIINRSGGPLMVELYNSMADESVKRMSPVTVFCDARSRTLEAGGILALPPGESITITPRLYHSFYVAPDGDVLICGEVSTVNDDQKDNRFAEALGAFSVVEEDEAPIHLLCNEYPS